MAGRPFVFGIVVGAQINVLLACSCARLNTRSKAAHRQPTTTPPPSPSSPLSPPFRRSTPSNSLSIADDLCTEVCNEQLGLPWPAAAFAAVADASAIAPSLPPPLPPCCRHHRRRHCHHYPSRPSWRSGRRHRLRRRHLRHLCCLCRRCCCLLLRLRLRPPPPRWSPSWWPTLVPLTSGVARRRRARTLDPRRRL